LDNFHRKIAINLITKGMPLPNILSGKTQRCSAQSKRGKKRCKNPAAYGMQVCRYHGARRPETIRSGEAHWNYQHGKETTEAKAERSSMLALLRELEALCYQHGFVDECTPRWTGRKPKLPIENKKK